MVFLPTLPYSPPAPSPLPAAAGLLHRAHNADTLHQRPAALPWNFGLYAESQSCNPS